MPQLRPEGPESQDGFRLHRLLPVRCSVPGVPGEEMMKIVLDESSPEMKVFKH